MVAAEPDKVFLVCYGENHRRSLHAALRDREIPCLSMALYPVHGMLGGAMRQTGGAIHGLCFGYEDQSYFMATGSYGTLLGCTKLDAAFLAARQTR